MTEPATQAAPPPAPPLAPAPVRRPGLHRRLYDWVLGWAYTPYGTPALCTLSFAESSFFPVPPDVLLLPLAVSRREKAIRFALLCSVFSVLGGMLGYLIGWGLWSQEWIQAVFFSIPGVTQDAFQKVSAWYQEHDFLIVFAAAFTPIPYKIFTIAAGVCNVAFLPFVLASLVGRSARFLLVGWLAWRYGAPVRRFIEKRFNLMTLVFTVLLGGGFVVVKYAL